MPPDRIAVDWIAVDWGTSNLRAWAMGAEGILASAESADGMGRLSRDDFEPALMRLVGPWLTGGPVPVVACGMVGARQGWTEAPYRPVPCPPVARGEGIAPPHDRRAAGDDRSRPFAIQTRRCDAGRGNPDRGRPGPASAL